MDSLSSGPHKSWGGKKKSWGGEGAWTGMGQRGCGGFSQKRWLRVTMGTGWSRPKHGHRPACSPSLGWEGQALTGLSAPPGLAVDYHNERLYWADAKLSVIGSIRLNGTDPIVAADSKRGQPPPAVFQASALPSGPKASPSACHPPHLALSSPAVPLGPLPTNHPQDQSCRPESTLTLWAPFTFIHFTNRY